MEIKTSKDGIDYINTVLMDKPLTITRASFWKIPRTLGDDLALKIGRYKKKKGLFSNQIEEPDNLDPKSELTLTGDEFNSLITFLQEHYQPFKQGIKKFITVDERFNQQNVENLKELFSHNERSEVIDFILKNNIIPEDLFLAFQQLSKIKAIKTFETMLIENLREANWQKWFTDNSWVLGTEFVKILEEREIDTANISDFLMQAYDGFIDIVEIKRPDGSLKFWADQKDHDNYIPHVDLIKAITQASKYIYEVEREANSVKFLERTNNIKTIKPRCILIFGRSNDWNDEQKESYRLLNSNYYNLSILTYDHILLRAKRLVE